MLFVFEKNKGHRRPLELKLYSPMIPKQARHLSVITSDLSSSGFLIFQKEKKIKNPPLTRETERERKRKISPLKSSALNMNN